MRRGARNALLGLALACMLAAGCATFSWETASVPYLGETPPRVKTPDTPWQLGQLKQLNLPGVAVMVNPHNSVTGQKLDVFFGVPVPRGGTPEWTYGEGGSFSLALGLAPERAGFVFDPARAVVVVDGREYATEHCAGLDGVALAGPVDLDQGHERLFLLRFPVTTPHPDQAIALRLGQALTHPDYPPLPEIRFTKVRWVYGNA